MCVCVCETCALRDRVCRLDKGKGRCEGKWRERGMRREILSSFCILPASLFHSFTRSVSFPLPLTSLSIFLPRSEPTQFPHPYLVILLSFFSHFFLSFSFSWSPSPHVYPHIFLCPSTLWFGHLTSDVLYDLWIVSDVLFTAWNNDIFILVQKAATHEAVSASIIQCIKKNWKIMIENYLNNFRCS